MPGVEGRKADFSTAPSTRFTPSGFGRHDVVFNYGWFLFALLDGEFGVVAVAGYDGVLLGMAFFVLHAEGVAFVVDQEDLDLAVAAVVLVVGGAVGKDVLV